MSEHRAHSPSVAAVLEGSPLPGTLDASETVFRDFFEHAPDGIFVADPKWHYIEVNGAARRMLGRSREEILALSVPDLFIPEDLEKAPLRFGALRDAANATSRRRLLHANGSHVSAEIRWRTLPDGSLIIVTRDVTERDRKDTAAEVTRRGLKVIAEEHTEELTTANVGLTDTNAGLTDANLGLTEANVGLADANVGLTDAIADLTDANLGLAGANADLTVANQGLTGANAGLTDANEGLTSANVELESVNVGLSEETTAKTHFLADMSHELRTPLNSIIGFTGILLQGLAGDLNEEQTRQIAMVHHSGMSLLSLVNDILDLSRIEAGGAGLHIEVFPVRELVDEVIGVVTPLATERGLILEGACSPRVGTIESDRRCVRQVLLNLLSNAVKFTGSGSVSLDVHNRKGSAIFDVHDSGCGIALAELALVFDEFYQASSPGDSKTPGTGLGLSVSRRLARILGGDVTATSQPGIGSIFTLRLPVVAA